MEGLLKRLGALGIICVPGSNSFSTVFKKPYVRSRVWSFRCVFSTNVFEITLLDKAGHPIEGLLPFFDIHSRGSTKIFSCVECVFRYISAICDYQQQELLGAITERTYKCPSCLHLPLAVPESSRLSMFIQIVVIGIVAGGLYSKFVKKWQINFYYLKQFYKMYYSFNKIWLLVK